MYNQFVYTKLIFTFKNIVICIPMMDYNKEAATAPRVGAIRNH